MRNRIQYFSTYDMSISYYLQNAEEIVELKFPTLRNSQ